MAESSRSQTTGRPSLEVSVEDIKYLTSLNFSKSKIAEILGISRKTLYNKIAQLATSDLMSTYTDITDRELDDKITTLKQVHPNDGEVMIAGHLLSEGIKVPRAKLRASIHRVDPEGTAQMYLNG